MATIKDFEELEVWKLAREICRDIYTITQYPALSRNYSLVDQMRRSSGSIMDNIAEGF
jgi:four helix bundle protein